LPDKRLLLVEDEPGLQLARESRNDVPLSSLGRPGERLGKRRLDCVWIGP